MTLPFTVTDFLSVFAVYNAAIWPAQIAALAIALVPLYAVFSGKALRLAALALAVLWGFTGIGYHLIYFARINPMAPVFAGLFILQAILFVASSARPGDLRLQASPSFRSAAGLTVIAYAVAVYPLLGLLAGHGGMAGPMFGVAPCPTTIFTLGILMLARGRWVAWLAVIPVLWSLIGLAAAIQLGIPEDLGLPVSGALLVGVLIATALLRRASYQKITP